MASQSHSRSRNVLQKVLTIFWIVLIIAVAAEFIYQAILKLFGDPVALAPFVEFGWPTWFPYVVAVTEIIASLLIFVPKTRRLGALILVGVMIGAATTNLVNGHPDYVWVNAVLIVAAALLFVQRSIDDRVATAATSKTSITDS